MRQANNDVAKGSTPWRSSSRDALTTNVMHTPATRPSDHQTITMKTCRSCFQQLSHRICNTCC